WGSLQFECRTKPGLEITSVRIRNGVKRTTMNNDKRRVLPTLVCVSQFRPEYTLAGRGLLFDRCMKLACQTRCRQLRERCRVGRIYGLHYLTNAALVQSRNGDYRCKR